VGVIGWSNKIVSCPLCGSGWATIKPTKTNHIMLRCDSCKVLIFANSLDSQDILFKMCNFNSLESMEIDYNVDYL